MKASETKKSIKKNFLDHKIKKRAYYLKNKIKKEINYEEELNNENFLSTIKDIAIKQKQYIDNRKELIMKKMDEYKILKKNYYENNKEKRLEYDKEYRERKKEQLKEYRRKYYEVLKENQ